MFEMNGFNTVMSIRQYRYVLYVKDEVIIIENKRLLQRLFENIVKKTRCNKRPKELLENLAKAG